MKKFITLTLSLVLSLALLTGCMDASYNFILDADGNGEYEMIQRIDKKTLDDMMDEAGMTASERKEVIAELGQENDVTFKTETYKGTEYYTGKKSDKFVGTSELQNLLEGMGFSDVYVLNNAKGIRAVNRTTILGEDFDELLTEDDLTELFENMSLSFSITMPEKILKYSSNGTLSSDEKTVSFSLKGKELMKEAEFMVSTASESNAPRITGFTDGNTYKNPVKVNIKDESGIKSAAYVKGGKSYKFGFAKKFVKNGKYTIKATDYYGNTSSKSFTLNDAKKPVIEGVKARTISKPYKESQYFSVTENCKLSSVKLSRTFQGKTTTRKIEVFSGTEASDQVSKTGKYTLTAKDVNGNTSTVKFVIDKVKPTIKGVKNNKKYTKPVTVKYSDNMKVKSATINGKAFKSGKKISKKGKYTVVVKDTAGNKKTVKFTIK